MRVCLDPIGPNNGSEHVMRGGSSFDVPPWGQAVGPIERVRVPPRCSSN